VPLVTSNFLIAVTGLVLIFYPVNLMTSREGGNMNRTGRIVVSFIWSALAVIAFWREGASQAFWVLLIIWQLWEVNIPPKGE